MLGTDWVDRESAKKQFFANAGEKDPQKLEELSSCTQYIIRELEAMVKFHKYRAMKKRYNPGDVEEGFTKRIAYLVESK